VNYGLYVILAILIVGAFTLSRRSRSRMVARQGAQGENITFGTEVMTTSGLYGTVVGLNEDDSVQLSIAPGVEVKWARAALRDAASLPVQYRKPITGDDSPDGPDHPGDANGDPPDRAS
jgi:preprotein translocase subunit YajC